MRLEGVLWDAYDEICRDTGLGRNDLIRLVESRRDERGGLTSSVRVFMLGYFISRHRQPEARCSDAIEDGLAMLAGALAEAAA
jgi:predicted DNA-binding ribbon-helix-helix protein